jgi:hypothetical protein
MKIPTGGHRAVGSRGGHCAVPNQETKTMNTLSQASHQWSTRPDDERFVSLTDLFDHFDLIRSQSKNVVVPSKVLNFEPTHDNRGLLVSGPNGTGYAPTHHAFGQLATLAKAPAGYLRTLPSPIAADNLNYGIRFVRDVEDLGLLLQKNGSNVLRCALGPNYGRVWNADVIEALIERFGDGRTGDWKVPGEYGIDVEITKANTTLYGSDRDCFVFLADEKNRVTIPNRRDGQSGTAARGFFVWNSEVGDKTLGIATFLFDYACKNRIVWGASGFQQITIKHTSGAPIRWVDEVLPVINAYQHGSAKPIEDAIVAAQAKKIDDVNDFLAKRFGPRLVDKLVAIHQVEESRPIETLWDAATAVTAYAKGVPHQDARVHLERQAGALLELVAA